MLNKRGYMLIELVVCIMIMSILSFSILVNFNLDFKHISFISDYHYLQSESIIDKEVKLIDLSLYNLNYDHQLYFNTNGNINMGATIIDDNYDYKIRLGFGNITYE